MPGRCGCPLCVSHPPPAGSSPALRPAPPAPGAHPPCRARPRRTPGVSPASPAIPPLFGRLPAPLHMPRVPHTPDPARGDRLPPAVRLFLLLLPLHFQTGAFLHAHLLLLLL